MSSEGFAFDRAFILNVMRRAVSAWKIEHKQRMQGGPTTEQMHHIEQAVIETLGVTVVASLGEGEGWFRRQVEILLREEI